MSRKTRRFLVPTLLAVALAPACSKDSLDKHDVSKATQADLALLPRTTKMVMGVSLAKARTSELYKKYMPALLANAPAELEQVKQLCGIDLINDVDSVVAGLGADLDERSTVVVIKGKITKDKLAKCISDANTKLGGGITARDEGKLTVYGNKDKGTSAYAYWVAADTVVLAPGAISDPKALDPVLTGAGLDDGLVSLVGNTDTGSVAWAAGTLPPQARAQMAALPSVPDSFFLSIDGQSDLQISLGMRFADDKAAQSTSELLSSELDTVKKNPPIPQLKGMLDAVKLDHVGKDLKLSVRFTMAQVEQVAGMASSLGL